MSLLPCPTDNSFRVQNSFRTTNVLTTMKGALHLILLLCGAFTCWAQYKPNWDSVDSRPLPSWYDDSKIGIFIHWGLFSVPSFGSEWFWNYWQSAKSKDYVEFMDKNYKPNFTYASFAPSFTCEFYDPLQWAKLINDSGARYVVLTSKHHEGYTMWPSKVSWNWNSVDTGPKRDLLGELAKAIRDNTDIHFGVYHSLYEWYNPLYLLDKTNKWQTQEFVKRKTIPELVELVETYQPEVIWSDGDWEAPDTYWNSTVFLAWLYNKSPVRKTVVVNDRWGSGIPCKHGGYFTCQDRYNPGKLQNRKWENAMTLDKGSWGFNRKSSASSYLTIEELLETLAETISFGGNLLINVGPTHDGRIIPIMEERLLQLGSWLKINGEAIYRTQPWKFQNDTASPKVWYTSSKSNVTSPTVYAIVAQWPKGNMLTLGCLELQDTAEISMLGFDGNLKWMQASTGDGINVMFPPLTPDIAPSQYAWVLKINGAK